MKKSRYIPHWLIALISGMLIAACENTDYPTYETDFTGIYFAEDSMRYSFGITPLATTSYTMKLPVKIMGIPVSQQRTFKIEIIADKTSAKVNTHYKMPTTCVIEADSINGILPLEVLRENLGDEQNWQVAFKLMPTDDFTPVKEVGEQIFAIFNNIVEQPDWKDWTGAPTWIEEQLGPWNPVVWIKFMEFFRKLEQINPVAYKTIVETYGPNLEDADGWIYEFNYTLTKYVLIPLYDFFQANPEYGIEMPNPNE